MRSRVIAYSAAIGLAFGAMQTADAQYTVTVLHPSGYDSSNGLGAGSGEQVGMAALAGSSTPHAALWTGSPDSIVDLHPGSDFLMSFAFDTDGVTQVGSGFSSTTFTNRALMWVGNAASVVDLHPAGYFSSQALAVSGGTQVGFGYDPAISFQFSRALKWSGNVGSFVDLTPAGALGAIALGTDGVMQAGTIMVGEPLNFTQHAVIWSGTADSVVDLHPAGFNYSIANAVSGSQQGGLAINSSTGITCAMFWNGTAASAVCLHQDGYVTSSVEAVGNNQQVGYAMLSGDQAKATLWEGTPESMLDLHQFLPAGYVTSVATGIDPDGNIVGWAADANGVSHAVLWKPASGYTFGGFLSPLVKKSSEQAVFKKNQNINVRFQLFDSNGNPVANEEIVASLECVTDGSNKVSSQAYMSQSNNGSLFKYDESTETYMYQVRTKNLTSGKQYRLIATVTSTGQEFEVVFSLR